METSYALVSVHSTNKTPVLGNATPVLGEKPTELVLAVSKVLVAPIISNLHNFEAINTFETNSTYFGIFSRKTYVQPHRWKALAETF